MCHSSPVIGWPCLLVFVWRRGRFKCMLRSCNRMHSSKAAVVLLSVRFPFCFCWFGAPPVPQQRQPSVPIIRRCLRAAAQQVSSREPRLYINNSSSKLGCCHLGPAAALQGERLLPSADQGCHQQPRRSFAVARRQLRCDYPLLGSSVEHMADIDAQAGAHAEACPGAQEKEEPVVLDREQFSREVCVVAVKVPARRTR